MIISLSLSLTHLLFFECVCVCVREREREREWVSMPTGDEITVPILDSPSLRAKAISTCWNNPPSQTGGYERTSDTVTTQPTCSRFFFTLVGSCSRSESSKRNETVKNEKLYWGGVERKQPGREARMQDDQEAIL